MHFHSNHHHDKKVSNDSWTKVYPPFWKCHASHKKLWKPMLIIFTERHWRRKKITKQQSNPKAYLTTDTYNIPFFMLLLKTSKKRHICKTSAAEKFFQMQINCFLSPTIISTNHLLILWFTVCNLTTHNYLKKRKRTTGFNPPAGEW